MPIANLKPFVTALPDIQNTITIGHDSLRRMSIVSVPDAVIYHDKTNNHKITAPVWTYEQTNVKKKHFHAWIGPTITARSGHKLQVEWKNDVAYTETNPIHKVVEATPTGGAAPAIPQNVMGSVMSERSPARPYFATHMHGGRTAPNYDGWPESMMLPASATHSAQSRRVRYDNDERASMLWYHDHAMHATAINVFSGLAGAYVITDDEEHYLQHNFNFPKGGDEIAMVIRDCNLTLDPQTPLQNGTTTTRLLHKTEDGVIEQFGPIHMVNGVIWPKRKVDPGLYRFRILNGANSRTYALQFVVESNGCWTKVNVPVHQIGSDGGLMPTPRDRTGEALVMMPAERLDLLVDFTDFANQNILLINVAAAPFGGDASLIPLAELPPQNPDCDLEDPTAPYDPDLNGPRRNPYPQIMRFDVKNKATIAHPSQGDLDSILLAMPNVITAPNPLDNLPAAPNQPTVRTVALLEKDMGAHMGLSMPPMLTTMELVPEAELAAFAPTGAATNPAVGEAPFQALHAARRVVIDGVPHRLVAERFQDAVNFIVPYGATEIWRFINLSPDSHPMHMHLVQFRQKSACILDSVNAILPDPNVTGATMAIDTQSGAAPEEVINAAFTSHPSAEVNITTGVSTGAPLETGLKDTIRVDPLTMVEVVATFEGYMGRYLYHCHLLEHEDHDMMRQFVVTRDDMMALMPHQMTGLFTSIGK